MFGIKLWVRHVWVAFVVGAWVLLRASSVSALPVTVTINQIVIEDVDHNQDVAATLYRYFVSSAAIGGPLSVTNVPHVGVCSLAVPSDNAAGCFNRITPTPGAWSFTRDVDPALGTVDVLIQVRNEDPVKLFPLDLSPGPLAPAEWGLGLTINLVDGTWRLRNDPLTVNPTTSSSDFIGPGAIDGNRLTGHVNFSVSLCGGGVTCSNGTALACEGMACTTDASAGPLCVGIPGTVTCGGGYACQAVPLPVPELQNGVDDDCDQLVDECNADQLGQTFDCTAPLGTCPSLPGVRTCTVANQPPSACVPLVGADPNVCQPECSGEVSVSTVAELREAIAQAHLTPCKDVIVLDPGFYDLTEPLEIDDSMEIRGIGSSFDCEGVDLDDKLSALDQLDVNIGSLRCDGDDGEDPGATVIRNVAQPATEFEESMHRVMSIGTPTSRPEVTLRHLTISGGIGQTTANPGSGILALGPSRLKLFNVVVEDNVARGPGAGIVHGGESLDYPHIPTFVMINSSVRRNRSTTPPLGSGIGLQGNGAGLHLFGVAFVLRSTVNDNAGIRGSGILAVGALHLYNSTITRNIAGQGGAGLLVFGLSDATGFLELHNNTITNNFAQWFSAQPMVRKDGAGVLAVGDVRVEAFGNIIADNVECRDNVPNGPNGANCSAEEGAAIQSLGGNLGSTDCAFSSVVSLPGLGPVASDTLVNLGYARDLADPTFLRLNDPFRAAVDSVCGIGAQVTAGGSASSTQLAQAQLEAQSALPPSNREVFDFTRATHLRLLGNLADQGGPTQTMAPTEGSLALGAARSFEHPGFIGDGFPSAPPLCPSADQRGFVVSGGNVPLICDAGSFQTAATAMLFVDDEAEELSRLFVDSDGDGISDTVDENPLSASASFGDLTSGGVTSGSIQSFGDQLVRVFDAFPNPSQGVLVLTLSTGGSVPAIVTACGGRVELVLEPGERQVVTCPQQPDVCVLARSDLQVGDRAQLAVAGVYAGAAQLRAANLSGDVIALGRLSITGGSVGGDARAGGQVTLSAGASVGGVVESNAYVLPRTIDVQSVEPGSTDVVVNNDQVRSIIPGAYRNLQLGDRAQLVLEAGNYSFEGLIVHNDATISLGGRVHVKVKSQFSVGDRVLVLGPGGAPAFGASLWYTNAAEVLLGHDVLWSGTIVAPFARLAVLDRASVDGCLAAEQILLSNDTSVQSEGLLPASGGFGAPTCSDGTLNQHETDVDCGGECGACQPGQACVVDSDCSAPAICVAGVCTAGAECSVATAIDLGIPGQQTTLSNAGCARVLSGYPSWWGVRTMKLEPVPVGSYPVPFTWSNSCGSGGSGLLTGDWQSQLLPSIDSRCPTLLQLQGNGSGSVTLRYWAQ
jgi:hypothetical protein